MAQPRAACHVRLYPGNMEIVSLPLLTRAVHLFRTNRSLGMTRWNEVASWISVGTLPLCVFLLLSYIVLPVKYTHRHYMSMCFTIGILFMQVRSRGPVTVCRTKKTGEY